jgi:hypothetical protein
MWLRERLLFDMDSEIDVRFAGSAQRTFQKG